jgi:ABC-type molybdate transport system permease subunit
VTLPVSIYADYVAGELENATAAVIALTAVSLLLITAYNRSTLSRQE